MAMELKNLPLPVLGLDLLSSETKTLENCVREADNIDITSEGVYSRRDGSSILHSLAEAHSLHKTSRGVLVGVGSSLFALAGGSLTEVCPVGGSSMIDFTEYNGHTYFTNGAIAAWIPSDSPSARRIGAPFPSTIPVLSETSGALASGVYTVALSRVDDRGEESGVRVIGQIDVKMGGILLAGLQVDLGCSYRAYITPPDGDMLYLSEEFSGAFSQYAITRKPDGALPTSRFLEPLPAGDFIRGYAGRIYVAKGDMLYYSEPLRPHLYDTRHNYVKFSGEIKFIEPVTGGIFVGDERGVWFLTGADPALFAQRLVSPAVAVKRSSLTLSGIHIKPEFGAANVAVWLSTEGYVVGTPDGNTVSLHPERIRVAAGLEGRSRFVVRDGNKQIITLVAATSALGFGVAASLSLQ